MVWKLVLTPLVHVCSTVILIDDDVYLESAAEREEYVLNKTGIIFRGTLDNPSSLHWNFAQVRKDGTCMYGHISNLLVHLMCNPVCAKTSSYHTMANHSFHVQFTASSMS